MSVFRRMGNRERYEWESRRLAELYAACGVDPMGNGERGFMVRDALRVNPGITKEQMRERIAMAEEGAT